MPIQTINPATGELVKTYAPMTADEVELSLIRSKTAYTSWRKCDLTSRQTLATTLADTLRTQTNKISHLMVLEMGKTLEAANAEIAKCINYCHYLSDMTPQYLADQRVDTDYKHAFTRPLPLGTILLVMPWNFPFWQVIRVALPAILAGNTVLLKHASNVPQCALLLEGVFVKTGFPKGVFQTLLIEPNQVAPLIADERIAAASLTGSETAGIAIGQACGKHIKKCVLELGGSDPFIVMPSANLDEAVDAALTSRMRNNGQSCIAAKRLILHTDIYDEFREGFLKRLNALKIGDPLHVSTDIGPLSTEKALDETKAQIQRALNDGAHYTEGQHNLPIQGFYSRPAILENITPEMRIFREEIFAPIAMLFRVQTMDEAIELANDTDFGLSSVLFSNDEQEINHAINALEAGSTFVNRYASSDICLPFGGIKRSGHGREMAKEGLREFTNLKTVIVANSSVSASNLRRF